MARQQGKPKQTKLETLKAKLLAEREQILGATNIDSDIDGMQNADMLSDVAAIAEHASHHLRTIDDALKMIESGSYGICKTCSGHIPIERLEIMPDCTMCVACSSQHR